MASSGLEAGDGGKAKVKGLLPSWSSHSGRGAWKRKKLTEVWRSPGKCCRTQAAGQSQRDQAGLWPGGQEGPLLREAAFDWGPSGQEEARWRMFQAETAWALRLGVSGKTKSLLIFTFYSKEKGTGLCTQV